MQTPGSHEEGVQKKKQRTFSPTASQAIRSRLGEYRELQTGRDLRLAEADILPAA